MKKKEMVPFYKQVIAASSRGVISAFTINVMISRHGGKYQKYIDTSITTISKTQRQLSAWMHPDHFSSFLNDKMDHQDLLHNGFLLLTQVAATLKTQWVTGAIVGGITSAMPFPKEQKEYFLRPAVLCYTSVWDTEDHKTSQYVVPVRKLARVLPETLLMSWKSKSGIFLPDGPAVHLDGSTCYARSS